ncbi:P-loop containing nucleoside triphosphate hydrolase protein [Rhodocollybia butyracea]|uniref:P-loop containing nucleoside triphosphate hydrolase protein n=1 Tax=Rhodocollybia butyracea TaxID=206335 RepID=A0A9P5U2S7_9AGAR|nr:P-loop containing nucleoside triphosphate hydrolase protein [Rhodocollybia butyracea]
MKLETKHLEERWDEQGRVHITEAGEAPPKNEADWADYVLTHTRHFDRFNGQYTHSDIEIKSKPLKSLLKHAIRNYPGVSFATDQVMLIMPAHPLFNTRHELWNIVKEEKLGSQDGREHLKYLLEWYQEEERGLITQYDDLVAQGLTTYSLLWTVMKPGCTIYSSVQGQPRTFVLINHHPSRDQSSLILQVAYTDFDGQKFGNAFTQLVIPKFSGTAPINSLEAYPLSWHPQKDTITEMLIRRGRLFEMYEGKHYMEYSGLTFGKNDEKFDIEGRVMVDAETFGKINPGRARGVQPFHKKFVVHDKTKEEEEAEAEANEKKTKTLTDEQCLQATSLVSGFAFEEKEWVDFNLEKLSPVRWNEDSFDQLVLPLQQKDMVKGLVQSHMKSDKKGGFDDFIKGKGKGMVMVLHGPPGVGKTLTAESLAEFTKRPLYMVSSGELGTTPSGLEENLAQIMKVATAWKAVLLLDEKRSFQDITRNALVSIFLRLLEYYQGVLVLTTNRVESFDEAFQSRIHVALKYHDLTKESRRAVWKNFLSRLGKGNEMDETVYDALQEYALNGRQIKNAVKTAEGLAEFKGTKVDLGILETVLNMQRDFARDFEASKKET